ncbi:MAG: flavodoxin family protein [Ruminococcaceae bacterium]|nr:flavodoxin family protein [Oscillospiraceae bacterium]
MKVLLVNGSPRKNGCTYTALNEMATVFGQAGIDTEFYHLGKQPVSGCVECYSCRKTGRCAFDDANVLVDAMKATDGFVLGSPVFYAAPNGAFLALLDRVFFSGGDGFRGKVSASIISCRRAGSTAALDVLNKYNSYTQTIIASAQYWAMVHGNTPEEVLQDEEGLQTIRTLATNMAWLLQTTQGHPFPPAVPKVMTNFIR